MLCDRIADAAKSNYLEAVEYAKAGDFDNAATAVERGNENYLHAHEAHFDLIQEEVSSESGLLIELYRRLQVQK